MFAIILVITSKITYLLFIPFIVFIINVSGHTSITFCIVQYLLLTWCQLVLTANFCILEPFWKHDICMDNKLE